MSLTASLSNALTGLSATSRAAQLVSSNVSNALTDGYGRKEIALSARVLGGGGAGVQVDGVVRVVDQGLLRDRRLADAALGHSDTTTAFLEKLSGLVGTPDDDSSISGRLRHFEATLITAASRPDSDTRLSAVLTAANDLAGEINAASDGLQFQRLEADRSIALQVDRLNAGLKQIEELNGSIATLNGAGRDVSALLDQRQKAIDALSEMVPLRELPRDDGRVTLYTEGGAILLQDKAVTIGFTPVNLVTSDMTMASGALSGLTINGNPVATEGSFRPMSGGTLGAAFDVRDRLGVAAQSDLDALARDLVERFADPGLDPTVAPGDPGLFTDAGLAFVPADETGLAGRLSVNAAVDPSRGGELRRMRDGLGSVVPGELGHADLLDAFAGALAMQRPVASGPSSGTGQNAHSLAAALTSRAAGDLVSAERQSSFAAAEWQTLREMELAGGVDTDQEMQKLLLIEQVFAANARVIQTIDALLGDLLAI